jgi:hypothetical protein
MLLVGSHRDISRHDMRVALGVITALLVGCATEPLDEVQRVPAPTRNLDAVLVETADTATTFAYTVYVVRKGKPAGSRRAAVFLRGATRSDSAFGLNLRWASDSVLILEHFKVQHVKQRGPREIVGSDTVRVQYRAGVVDSLAPRGGMRDNLGPR